MKVLLFLSTQPGLSVPALQGLSLIHISCGTGTCAAVVAATLNGFCEKGKDIRVILKGGELKINYTDERILMTGKAEKVYDGAVEV